MSLIVFMTNMQVIIQYGCVNRTTCKHRGAHNFYVKLFMGVTLLSSPEKLQNSVKFIHQKILAKAAQFD